MDEAGRFRRGVSSASLDRPATAFCDTESPEAFKLRLCRDAAGDTGASSQAAEVHDFQTLTLETTRGGNLEAQSDQT